MRKLLIGMVLACTVGCGASRADLSSPPATPKASQVVSGPEATAAPAQVAASPVTSEPEPGRDPNAPWIGAAGASDFVLAGASDTLLGVWVDVPVAAKGARAPVALALIVDTSGSMAGAKMDNARAAAKSLVDGLADGDIVSIGSFADQAQDILPATRLDRSTRARVLASIQQLVPTGGTNLFDGLRLGEVRAAGAPATHPVRRVVVISDGVANIGPSSPELLGAVAARGADQQGIQVTAIGVGLDYDENTLNALAIRSSGRLHHLAEPGEMPKILEQELALLNATKATSASIEIVPAPGVQVLGADGVRTTWQNGALVVPLGSMYGGQHREMLVRVRVNDAGEGVRPLASVRLHFRDPAEGNLDRVQEVVARYELTRDPAAVASRENAKTQSIVAVQEAAQASVKAAQQVSSGDFEGADRQLAQVEEGLRASAKKVTDGREKQRVLAAADSVSHARKGASAAAAAPPAARPAKARAEALDMNSAGMVQMGY